VTITEHHPLIAGHDLHRLILSPAGEPRGSLLFFHGQGDYIDRYPPILESFVKAGFRCLLSDLPGHGRSPGKRGSVPGLVFLEALFKNSLDQLSGPLIIAGHSVGGLVALRFLLRYPQKFAAAWISSPLLDPMGQAKPWMRSSLPVLASLFPWITVSTGVRAEDCGDSTGRGTEDSDALYHSRISLGWGRDLRDAAAEVHHQFPTLPTNLPILFTQGALDPVCPPDILRKRLAKLPANQISCQEIPAARHEPFTGSTEQEFLTHLNLWISSEIDEGV
jgi:alpha-beta hydrolase superfamily lysophospholipase